MTIQFEKLKARLLANPKVKAEYVALAPEFEIAAELLRARLRAGLSQAELAARMGTSQSTIARTREWPHASEHQDTAALRRGNRQQVSRAAIGRLTRSSRSKSGCAEMNPIGLNVRITLFKCVSPDDGGWFRGRPASRMPSGSSYGHALLFFPTG